MKNYYEILEVNEKASKETISKVFKMQIKKNHPDLFQGDEKKSAEEKTMLLNEAYEVLSDEKKRLDYDKQIDSEKEDEIAYLKEQINVLKEELIKKQTILQEIRNEFKVDEYIQRTNIQNEHNVNNTVLQNEKYRNESSIQKDSFRDLKRFMFRLILFIGFGICILFMLGQILDKDLLGELYIRLFRD